MSGRVSWRRIAGFRQHDDTLIEDDEHCPAHHRYFKGRYTDWRRSMIPFPVYGDKRIIISFRVRVRHTTNNYLPSQTMKATTLQRRSDHINERRLYRSGRLIHQSKSHSVIDRHITVGVCDNIISIKRRGRQGATIIIAVIHDRSEERRLFTSDISSRPLTGQLKEE